MQNLFTKISMTKWAIKGSKCEVIGGIFIYFRNAVFFLNIIIKMSHHIAMPLLLAKKILLTFTDFFLLYDS